MKLCVRILSTAVAIISGLTATAVTPDSIAGKMINVTDISAESDSLAVDSLAADTLINIISCRNRDRPNGPQNGDDQRSMTILIRARSVFPTGNACGSTPQ